MMRSRLFSFPVLRIHSLGTAAAALMLSLGLLYAETHEPPDGYELVWYDNFDVDGRPDPENWTYENGFVRNRELQFYQPDNARVEDGHLVITARRETVSNPRHDPDSSDWRQSRAESEYTSASILTRGRQSWQYGRFELRARIDVRPGLWPAWWALGVDGEWPSNGEIDMMEYYNGNIYANAAWGTEQRWTARWDAVATPLAEFEDESWDDFHIWRMDWDEDFIRIYLNDRLLNEVDLSRTINPDGTNPFRQPHYMLINLAVGSNGGDPSETEFPARYEVDWVRVFQKVEDR